MSVIVPAQRAGATIGATIAGLERQDLDAPFEVLIVDEGSLDSEGAATLSARGWTVVPRPPDLGAGAARNLGASRARGEVIAFTDADCVPHQDWLRRGLDAIEGLDLLQGRVIPDRAARRDPFDRTVAVWAPTGLFESANLFVRRTLFERLGGFEDWLIPRSGGPLAEDVWLGWSAHRAGARIGFSEAATVEHAVVPRSMRDFAAERRRLEYFPAIVRKVPELRREMMFLRVFLNRRSAALDLALAGAVAAAVAHPALLVAAGPYLYLSLGDAARWRRRAPAALLGGWMADLTGLVALAIGSIRYRRPLL